MSKQERSKKGLPLRGRDCFASLAMTWGCRCEAQSAEAISDTTDHLEVIEFNVAALRAKIKGDREPRGML